MSIAELRSRGKLAARRPLDHLTGFAIMLDANLFGRGTGGASVALEPDSGTLMLSRSWSLGGSESGELLRGFSAFVGATEAWKTRIDDAFWRDPDAQPPAEPPGAATPTVVKVQPRLP